MNSGMKIRAIILFLVLSVSFCGGQELIKIYVNGIAQKVSPHMENGVAYMPANPLASALGMNISWDPNTRILKMNNNVISTKPLVKEGILYLPVESIASSAGATVEWDGKGNSIRIFSSGKSMASANSVHEAPPPAKPVEDTSSKPADSSVITQPYVNKSGENPPSGAGVKAPDTDITYVHQHKSGLSAAGVYTPTSPSYSSGGTGPTQKYGTSVSVQPKNAPPSMPSNLQLPPMGSGGQGGSPNKTFSSTSPYRPRSEASSLFRVTVTNMEYVDTIKDYYKPKPGYKFVIVYLNQQNVSDEVQIYTGKFSLLDQSSTSYDYIEGLSNFWLVILRPGGTNFGYLTFEIPGNANPDSLVLHGLSSSPLKIKL